MNNVESINGGYREPPSGFEQAVESKVVDDVPWWRLGPNAGLISFGVGSSETFGGRPPDGVGCWIVGRMCAALDEACGYEISENKRIVEKAWKVMDEAKQEIREHNRAHFRYRIVSIANIPPEPIEMIIDPILPRGELIIIDGDPDVGKSWLWMALVAGLTGSKVCPLPSPLSRGDSKIPSALILTTEDDPAKTIRPRLEKLGANLNQIMYITFTHKKKMSITAEDFKEAMIRIKQVRPDIVIIDPLTLYATTEKGFDSNKATSVRRMLNALVEAARELNAVFLVNRHFGKTPKRALHQGIGSIDYAAAARSMMIVAKDPSDPFENTRIVAHIKSNLVPRMKEGLMFSLDEKQTPPFQWQGMCEVDPDCLTDFESASEARDEKSKLAEAMDFLRQILADGPVPFEEIQDQARRLVISERTLRRAREELLIVSRQSGFAKTKVWEWSLP
jgi:hypothetical protein